MTRIYGQDISPALPKFISGSGGQIAITPNQIQEFEFNLSHLCKFDEIGTYKIIAKKRLFPSIDDRCEMVSNPLNVVISK